MRKYLFKKTVDEGMVGRYNRNDHHLRCYLCGHIFILGEQVSLVNNNGWKDRPTGDFNPLVCDGCDGEDVLDRWVEHCKEAKRLMKGKFWWLNDTY